MLSGAVGGGAIRPAESSGALNSQRCHSADSASAVCLQCSVTLRGLGCLKAIDADKFTRTRRKRRSTAAASSRTTVTGCLHWSAAARVSGSNGD